MQWICKKTQIEKEVGRSKLRTKRLLEAPTRKELLGKVDYYCKIRKLSSQTKKDIDELVNNNLPKRTMDLDYRKVSQEERVPRSLRYNDTPPRYWDIFI